MGQGHPKEGEYKCKLRLMLLIKIGKALNKAYNKLEITSNDDKSVAKVVAEPLEKGFGQTIGNSLRRILLIIHPRSCSYCNSN